jgi:hypothetical protein
MKRSKAPFGIGVALLLAASSTVLAAAPLPAFLAAAPGSSPALAAVLGQPAVAGSAPATPADDPTCGRRMYSCQSCSPTSPLQKLCYEQICGTYVIVHCDPCAINCSLPPG